MSKQDIKNKSYGENLIQIEEGFYSISDLENIVLEFKAFHKKPKKMLKASMKFIKIEEGHYAMRRTNHAK